MRAVRRASVSNMQREQSGDLGIVRQQMVDGPRQADGLMRQVAPLQFGAGAAGIAFVEDQVQHVQNGARAAPRAPAESAFGMGRRRP